MAGGSKRLRATPFDAGPHTISTTGRKPGEQPDLRTATSQTILNPDGSWTLKSYGAPINYQDAQGHWQPIDPTLIGDSSVAGYAYGNKANGWHVHFASQAGGPALVEAQFPGVTSLETLQGAATVPAQINGSQIVYPSVFPDTDLLYQVGSTTLEETLLLHNAQGPSSYTFVYNIPGASAHQDASGNVIFTDAAGHVLLVVGGLFMFEADATGQMLPTGLGSQAIQVSLTSQGSDFAVTLTPDASWLSNPQRHFPVAIDPSQNWTGGDSGQNTTNGNIFADTTDESGNPTTNYWNNTSVRIGNCNATQGTGTSRAYFKFPIGSPPAGVRVTSATLALFQTSEYGGGLGVPLAVNAITSPWNATTLTWNTHPTGFGYAGQGGSTASSQLTWANLDVSDAAALWWQGGFALNGLEVQYANESQQCQFFESDNATSNRPSLTINYVQDQTAPTGSLVFNGGATSTKNATVTVQPSALDPGSLEAWNSNWTSVNGLVASSPTNGSTLANLSVDSSHAQVIADTSSCGSTQCWAETTFSSMQNINNWPTFTAAFETDTVNNFQFGVISAENASTRLMLTANASGFTQVQVSTSSGSWNVVNITTIPLSANTWYVGQVSFPLPNVGFLTIWPLGQSMPATPSVALTGVSITDPTLNLWQFGDNGANLHHTYLGNVTMTVKDTTSGTTGYGVSQMSVSSNGSTWGCPAYSGTPSISGGPWCIYSNQSFPWTFSGPDGKKTLWYQYVDNTGQTVSGTSQIIYDTTPPVVNSLNPGNGNEVRGVVTVQVNATDPPASDGSSSGVASAVLYVDGVQAGSPVSGTSAPTFLWDTTDLSQGVHILTATATDAAGNTSAIGGSTKVIVSNTSGMPSALVGGFNVANGDAVVSTTDLSIPGVGPNLSISRTYHALGGQLGLFGFGWTSELDEGLSFPGDGSAVYTDPSGGYHVFLPNGSGGYLASPSLYLTLVKNGDGTYTLSARNQSKTNFNASGQITSVVDRHGNTLTISYSGGLPTTVTDASGRALSITITSGHITQISSPGPRVYSYAYDGSGNLTDYTNAVGVVTHYTYDSSHHLLTITENYVSGGGSDQQTNVVTTLTYDTENRLVKLLDPMGYDTNLSYSTVGAASQTTVKRLQGISPATYATTVYQMTTDGMGAVAQVTDALNNVTHYQYDANENVTQVTDPDGRVSTSTYDSNGNVLTHIVDPGSSPHLNLTTTTTYDSANNVLTVTNPLGIVTQITYDSPTAGDPVKVVADYVNGGPSNSDTNVTSTMTYDSFGEVLTSTDPLGIVTKKTYDSQGDLLSTIANYKSGVNPDFQTNVTTSSTYDVLGERITATNPLGIVTQYTYDNLGRLLKTVANYQSGVNPDQQTNVTTSYAYDALNRQITVTDPLGIVTQTVYDADGHVTQTVLDYVNGGTHDTQTNVVSSTQTYDAMGNVLTATDAKGNVTTTTYDLDNHPLQTTQKDSSGTVLQNGQVVYDAAGQVIERDILDANNHVLLKLTYGFDNAGRNTTTTLPPALPGVQGQAGTSTVSTTTYDANGQAIESKTTNAALPSPSVVNDATVSYDHLGRVLSKTEEANTSSAQTTSFVYDLDGRQTSVTDPSNQVTSSTYDALGAVLTTTHPDSTVDTMTYDAAGELLSTANSAGTTKDTYDPLGRVTYDERDDSTGTLQTGITYTYDANGNKTAQQTTFAGGTNTTYRWTYDKLNRAATMSDGTRTYTYDLNSNVTQMTVAVGSNTIGEDDYTYDGANRLTGLTAKVTTGGTTLHTYGYTYDALGNRTQITTDGTALNYTYDNLTELTSVQQGSSTLVSYSYDANSNRTSMITSAGTTGYTYDSSDTMLVSKTDPNGKITNYTYDTNGNLLKATFDPSGANQITSYVYDKQNRLTEVDEPTGNKIQFTYDADGNRISKTVTASGTSTTIKDVYALGHLSEQTDGSGNPLATFTYEASGRPASVVLGNPSTGTRYYYVYNGHGDVVALTDSSGNVVASYQYDAFGVLTSSSENFPNGWSNPYRYDGADLVRYDSETGLYWMSVRAYDPTLGRFISHDPLGRLAAQGIDFHPYVYTDNNPVNKVDPSGQRYTCGSGDCGGSDCPSGQQWNGQTCVTPIKHHSPTKTPPPTHCTGSSGTRTGAHVCTTTNTSKATNGSQDCNAACQARSEARDANRFFNNLAANMWIDAAFFGTILTLSTVLLGFALTDPVLWPFVALTGWLVSVSASLAFAAVTVAYKANAIASDFNTLASAEDGWWTSRNNITGYFDGMKGDVASMTGSLAALGHFFSQDAMHQLLGKIVDLVPALGTIEWVGSGIYGLESDLQTAENNELGIMGF